MTDAASARPVGIGELARPAHDIQRRREICETCHPAMPKSCRYHQLRPRSRTLNHPRDSAAIGDGGVASPRRTRRTRRHRARTTDCLMKIRRRPNRPSPDRLTARQRNSVRSRIQGPEFNLEWTRARKLNPRSRSRNVRVGSGSVGSPSVSSTVRSISKPVSPALT